MTAINELIKKIDDLNLWSREIELKRHDFLNFKGSLNTDLYYVIDGSLRIYFEDEGIESTIRLAYQGNLIVALDSFLSEKPSELYIQALKKCRLKVISKSIFLKLVNANEANLRLWQSVLESFVLQQIEREMDVLIQSPRERYNRVMKRSPHLFQVIPAKHIAAYLRMSPETLSRLKKS